MVRADILLVEDDDGHAELIARCFEEVGADVVLRRVGDGETALALLEAAARGDDTLPALVHLDLRLPRMDGLTLLGHLKAHATLRRVPVVVLTTSKARADLRGAYDRHVNSYLVKPLELARLSGLLAEVAHYWGLRNRLAT
jgi:CheY-like chemotaxis protein